MKTVVIIPSRMASKRFPNKPLAKINGIPMIQRVWNQAIKAQLGDVYVACSEKEVFNVIKENGGNVIMTNPDLQSGTDRVYYALLQIDNYKKYRSVINLQGDMPLIDSDDIIKVNEPIKKGFKIGTLATNLSTIDEKNKNITKVKVNWINRPVIGEAEEFYKDSKSITKNIYQHVGIYSFTLETLKAFVEMTPSKNELNLKLEQYRALDAGIKIGITYVGNIPISVDTKEDLIHVENIIKSSDEKN